MKKQTLQTKIDDNLGQKLLKLCRQKDLYTYKKLSGKRTFRKTLNCDLEPSELCFGLLLVK